MANKDLVPITDHCLWNAMQLKDMVKIELSHGHSCVGVRKRKEMCILTQSIHHHQDGVLSSRLRQPFYEAVSYTHLTLPTNREV